jgi:hypothetical protein
MSVLWLLLILGSAVAVLTDAWRHGDIDLTGKDANLRGVYLRSMAVGIAVCLLLRINIIDMARGEGIGWMVPLWGARASVAERAGRIVEQIGGIAVAGVIVALAAKFWNDAFDILYEFKRWVRGHANVMKPEPRISAQRTVRRSRSSRRRGGSGGGGGGGGNDAPREQGGR